VVKALRSSEKEYLMPLTGVNWIVDGSLNGLLWFGDSGSLAPEKWFSEYLEYVRTRLNHGYPSLACAKVVNSPTIVPGCREKFTRFLGDFSAPEFIDASSRDLVTPVMLCDERWCSWVLNSHDEVVELFQCLITPGYCVKRCLSLTSVSSGLPG
jgi:hypothetical protein